MKILLDLDEVLVDFIGGACKAFNVDKAKLLECWTPGEWDIVPPLAAAKGFRLTPEFFWAVINERGERFWEELELLPWAQQILDLVTEVADEWFIISAPSLCPTSYAGKTRWLKNYFGKDFDRFTITPHKELFAKEGVLLIDDRAENVEKFIKAGGDGLVFPRYHNDLHKLKDDPVCHIRRMLSWNRTR